MQNITKIKYKYKYDESYNPVFITGIQGGFSSFNEMFVMNFFQERYPIPKTMTYDISTDKIIETTPKSDEGTVDIVRFFETGVTCTLDTAIEIHKWLTEQINEALEEEEH